LAAGLFFFCGGAAAVLFSYADGGGLPLVAGAGGLLGAGRACFLRRCSRMMLFPMQMGEGLPLPGRALLFDVEK